MRRPLLPPSHVTRVLCGLAGTALAGALVIDHLRVAPEVEPSAAPPRAEEPLRAEELLRAEEPSQSAVPFVIGSELPETSPAPSPQARKPRHAPPAPRPRKFICGPCGMG